MQPAKKVVSDSLGLVMLASACLNGKPVKMIFFAPCYAFWLNKFSFNSLQDLIKQTPEDHADYEVLTNVLNTTKDFLAKITGDDRDSGVSNMLGSTNIAEAAKQSETSIFIVLWKHTS